MAAHDDTSGPRRAVDCPAWQSLDAHAATVRAAHLRDLFAADPDRGTRLTAEALGIYFDYSKSRVTDLTLALLLQLARESGLRERIDAMFRGDRINVTEKRAVLHVALRAPRSASMVVDGQDVMPQVHAVLDRMAAFCRRVASGEWKGHTGRSIRAIVNIGIGGSDLGPVMAYEALRHYCRPRADASASCRTSTGPTSRGRVATSIRPRRCSSCHRRRSRRSRR